MSQLIDFYDTLSNEVSGTIDVDGVVLAWKNKGKWHACKKGGGSPQFVCGSGAPTDPHRTGYGTNYDNHYKKSAKSVTPHQFLELNVLCKNCQRMMEDEYALKRVISAVPSDAPDDAWKGIIERFVERASKEIDESK